MAEMDIKANYPDAELVKRGGQKTVYVATDPDLGKVILKVGTAGSVQSLERIRREVELLRDIDSVYFPRNFEFRELGDGNFLIVEEFVDAVVLGECLNRFASAAKVLCLLEHLTEGLVELWSRRVVHRDIKPDNVLIAGDDVPKIIDLGIARLLDKESLTHSIALRGPCTPVYAAPEQLRNQKDIIDKRTDQFLLGLLGTQLLLQGRHPFDPAVVGTGESIVTNIISGTWATSALRKRVPESVFGLACRLLGHEPHQRFRRTETLLDVLRECRKELE